MSRAGSIKEIEEFSRRIKIFFIVILFLLLTGILGFKIMTGASFEDSFFRTIQTLAFMFEEEPPIYERLLEVFLAIIGVFLIWWVLWSVADMILDGNLSKYLKTRIYSFKIRKMREHIIIVGGGRVGEEISKIAHSKKESSLIIELDPKVVSTLRKKRYIVLEGDASDEAILKKAEIQKASKIVLTLPKTETNILISLTAKELNPNVEVYARCENSALVSKLKKAGAKVVVIPEILAGEKIAKDLGF